MTAGKRWALALASIGCAVGSPMAGAQVAKSAPVEVAFNGFPETRSYSVSCSENEAYEVAFSFGAPDGIDLRGDGVALARLTRTSTPITEDMTDDVAEELKHFASISSVTFRCGWRQAVPEKESGNYFRMEFAGIRNCLTETEAQRLEEVGSIDQRPFYRFIEIRPTTVAVEAEVSEKCAPGDIRR
ncbi:MAG: hypothetical protein AAGA09_08895 [Pseudomonadota bacterium]